MYIHAYWKGKNNKQDKEIIIDTSRLRDRERVRGESERAREREGGERETE